MSKRLDDGLQPSWKRLIELSFKVGIDVHSEEYIEEMDTLRERIIEETDDLGAMLYESSQLGEIAQYLAKLYLYGHGDARSSDVLKSTTIRRKRGFVYAVGEVDIPVPVAPKDAMGEVLDFQYARIEIADVTDSYAVGTRISAREDGNHDKEETIAISKLCMELFRFAVADSGYVLDMDTDGPQWHFEHYKTFAQRVTDEIMAGNVAACANCGRPIYLGRKNASPFCNRGHYTRYREKAKRMAYKGYSLEEVHAAYPEIGKTTIMDWIDALNRGC